MDFRTAAYTDVGIRKKTNQDSALIEIADTDCGRVFLAVVCDGVGGLAMGEVASAVLVRSFSDWFEKRLPYLLCDGLSARRLQEEWEQLVISANQKIMNFGKLRNVRLGTTLAAFLAAGGSFYIINVGDSRIYQLRDSLLLLTRDQSFVQREVDAGRMTCEEARTHPRRNVLLQCVGAGTEIRPEFLTGSCLEDTMFLICSDGFHHALTAGELFRHLNPGFLHTEQEMERQLGVLTEWSKERLETDNITAVLVRIC